MGGERYRVLVVDDDDSITTMLAAVLPALGNYEPIVASSYDRACALLEQQEFDVVLSDLDLQNRRSPHNPNGYDLCKKVYELGESSGRKIPFVMLTGTVLGREEWVPKNVSQHTVTPYATLVKGEGNITDITNTLQKAIQQYKN